MKKKIIIIPVLLIAFGIFMSSFVVTKPGEYRVIKQLIRHSVSQNLSGQCIGPIGHVGNVLC